MQVLQNFAEAFIPGARVRRRLQGGIGVVVAVAAAAAVIDPLMVERDVTVQWEDGQTEVLPEFALAPVAR